MTSSSRREFIQLSGKTILLSLLPFPLTTFAMHNTETNNNSFEVIIVGGSYAGLAAAMALGRAVKKTLVIDNGKPCNRQTPHSHNFLTNDGKTPSEISATAKEQVSKYDAVHFLNDTAINAKKIGSEFQVQVTGGEIFTAKKIIFATGIRDMFPPIEGFSECWGISVLHCPYCHGYEIRNVKTGILANDSAGFEFAKLISNWTNDLTVFTNGATEFTSGQIEELQKHGIKIVESVILSFKHSRGFIKNILFKDGSVFSLEAIYAPVPFVQHCEIPEFIGCELTEAGYIKIDDSYVTTIPGVYAIGDNATKLRTVANAVAMGTAAGMSISKKMIIEEY